MDGAPVYIIKKRKSHGGHHGGAWKVAYADFVTAMMALFIVLWLLSTSEAVKKAVGGYFSDPTGKGDKPGSEMVGGSGDGLAVSHDDMDKLKQKLEEAMKTMPEFKNFKNQVELTITSDGLRVELIETEKGIFFESGIAKPTEQGERLLLRLAKELGGLPNKIAIEGHTDAKPYGGDGTYSNWELSADRANAARRAMQSSGIRPDQVTQVRGFADQRLRVPKDPMDASNRRISVIVHYLNTPPSMPYVPEGAKGAEGSPKGAEPAKGGEAANGKNGKDGAKGAPAGAPDPHAQPQPASGGAAPAKPPAANAVKPPAGTAAQHAPPAAAPPPPAAAHKPSPTKPAGH